MVPEVPKEILHLLSAWAAPVLTVPVPTAAAALSPAPAHTVTPCGRPNAAAVSGSIRSEEITIDVRICAALAANRGSGVVYLAAIAPDMELTVITLDEAPDILPCFDEDDAYLNIPDSSLLLSYNPAQVLKLAGKHYLTGLVILVRTNMDGGVISLTIDEVYLFVRHEVA